MIKRGEIYWVNLDDVEGYETKNIRPCLVVSNDIQNRIGKRIMIAPLTSNIKKQYPFEVVVRKLKSKVMLDQVRVITISKLGKRASWLIKEEIEKVDLALHISLGIKICPSK